MGSVGEPARGGGGEENVIVVVGQNEKYVRQPCETYAKLVSFSLSVKKVPNSGPTADISTGAFESLLDSANDYTNPEKGVVLKRVKLMSYSNSTQMEMGVNISFNAFDFSGKKPLPQHYGPKLKGNKSRNPILKSNAPINKGKEKDKGKENTKNREIDGNGDDEDDDHDEEDEDDGDGKKGREGGSKNVAHDSPKNDQPSILAQFASAAAEMIIEASSTSRGAAPPVSHVPAYRPNHEKSNEKLKAKKESEEGDETIPSETITFSLTFKPHSFLDSKSMTEKESIVYSHPNYDYVSNYASFDWRLLECVAMSSMGVSDGSINRSTSDSAILCSDEIHSMNGVMHKMVVKNLVKIKNIKSIRQQEEKEKRQATTTSNSMIYLNLASLPTVEGNKYNAVKIPSSYCEEVRKGVRNMANSIKYVDVYRDSIDSKVCLSDDPASIPTGVQTVSFCLEIEYVLVPFSKDQSSL